MSYPTQNTIEGYITKLTKIVANAVQQHDLLNFRLIGQEEYLKRVSVVMLKNPKCSCTKQKTQATDSQCQRGFKF